jgi:hypothetical protein
MNVALLLLLLIGGIGGTAALQARLARSRTHGAPVHENG